MTLQEMTPTERIGKMSKDRIKFTQWFLDLVILIHRDGTDLEDIAVSNEEAFTLYEEGVTPEYVYVILWDKDAGNFYRI